jgi:tetratricopeptide (TPR) repeat protein
MKKINLILLFFTITISITAQESFKSLCDKGNKEADAQNYEKALEYFDKALNMGAEDSSEVAWTATIASICAIELNDEKKAIGYNNIAIRYGSTYIPLIDEQLDLAKKYKDNNTILEVLQAARKMDGQYQKYTIKLLYYYYNNKMYDETIVTAEEVLAFRPNHTNSLYFKGVALEKIGKQAEAILLFEAILSREPDNAKVNAQLGIIYFNKGSVIFDKANARYKSLASPTRSDFHNYTKEIKKASPHYKKCLGLLKKANELKPKQSLKDAISRAENRVRQIEQD